MKKTLLTILAFHFSLVLSAQGLWSKKASLPAAGRYDGMGFAIGNYGYAGLGANISTTFHDFWQFNPSTNKWVQKASFPGKARYNPATFVIGHKAFVVTGEDSSSSNFLTECWEYDANSNTWAQKNNFPGAGRTWAFGFAIGNRGFIGTGGQDISTLFYYKDFWEYDTASDTWTQKADFGGIARGGACGFAVEGNGYVCFGQDSNLTPYNDMWAYDTTTNLWTQKSSLSSFYFGVWGAGGVAIGSNIYVGTGQNYDSSNSQAQEVKAFWKYNIINDSWTKQASFIGAARADCSTSFAIADSGYLGFGADGAPTFYNDWYKFYPDTITGIDEIAANENGITVYPNPSSGAFKLQIRNYGLRITNVEIYNMLGEKIYSSVFNIQHSIYNIDISDQPSGIYVMKVTNPNSIFYNRIIIN